MSRYALPPGDTVTASVVAQFEGARRANRVLLGRLGDKAIALYFLIGKRWLDVGSFRIRLEPLPITRMTRSGLNFDIFIEVGLS